jgi:hypothetical protein
MTTLLDIRPRRVVLKADEPAKRLVARLIEELDTLADGINSGALSPVEWHNAVANALLRGHVAAYMEGRDVDDLAPGARKAIGKLVGGQVEYLNKFLDQVEADGWQDGRDRARSAMYARNLVASYERGKTFGLDLPAYPGDGSTQCMTNCKCSWRIKWIDQEELDADCYWDMGSAEHCEDCVKRARQWAPLRIRGGEPT